MLSDELHPLFGKPTVCHQCDGTAVWVQNGPITGSYHYCRSCKIETGPFAKDVTLPSLEVVNLSNTTEPPPGYSISVTPDGKWFVTNVSTTQLNQAMLDQEQLLLPGFENMADHPV